MTNVHDPFDDLANALGVGLACSVDAGSGRLFRGKAGVRDAPGSAQHP
jgi:hypothetical protein